MAVAAPVFHDNFPWQDLVCGTVDKMVDGELPIIANKDLPEEDECRSWTRESQLAYWRQRKAHWNRQKMRDLVTACRKRFICPCGEGAVVKDRLLMYDFAFSQLPAYETNWSRADEELAQYSAPTLEKALQLRREIDVAKRKRRDQDTSEAARGGVSGASRRKLDGVTGWV